MSYDGADDSRKCYALAIEAMQGHIYVDVENGKATAVCHRHNANGHEEFRVPMTRTMLLILMKHVCNALQRLADE